MAVPIQVTKYWPEFGGMGFMTRVAPWEPMRAPGQDESLTHVGELLGVPQHGNMKRTSAKKFSVLEETLLAISTVPVLASFSVWKLIWTIPLLAAASYLAYGEHPRRGRFFILVSVVAVLTAISFITQVWMAHPPNNKILERYFYWESYDFGNHWWFLFDLIVHAAIVIVAARLTFRNVNMDRSTEKNAVGA